MPTSPVSSAESRPPRAASPHDGQPPSLDLGHMLVGVVFLVSATPLALYVYIGQYVRYVADDFCTAGTLVSRGFVGSQAYWYAGWTGRFAFTASVNLLEMVGPQAPRYLPVVLVFLWIAVTGWALRQLFEVVGRRVVWEPYLLAAAGLGGTYAVAPSLFQSFYWQTGVVTYLLPTLLMVGQAGLVLHVILREDRVATGFLIVLVGGLSFLAGGFSEVNLAIQTASYAGLVAWAFLRSPRLPRRVRWVAAAGLGGSLLAAGVVLLAPGNQTRLDLMPEAARFGQLIISLPRYAAAFAAKSLLRAPAVFLGAAMLGVGVAAGRSLRRTGDPVFAGRSVRCAVLLLALSGGMVLISMTPPAVATAAYPVDRALLPATVILVWVSIGVGWLLGEGWIRRQLKDMQGRLWLAASWTLSIVGALAIAVSAILVSAVLLSDARDFAAAWDRREARMRESLGAGVVDVVVRPLPHIGDLAELEEDPQTWVNACFSSYYGVESVRVE